MGAKLARRSKIIKAHTERFLNRKKFSQKATGENVMRIENLTFADRLRFLAKQGQYGHVRQPHNYYPSDNTMSECPWDWMNREVARIPLKHPDGSVYAHKIASEPTMFNYNNWKKFCEFARRYRRFYYYLTEILPEWKETKKINYMDNSVEVEEVDKNGNKRQRMTVSPHGDLCF